MLGDNMIVILKKILWGIATILLLTGGIYFTKKLSFLQFNFKEMFHGFRSKQKDKISPFQTLMMSLAARIGVGSLAGIALAIHLGGIGTIFWIWVTTIITAPNAFAESCLGILYREKDGEYHKGGPAYYIKKGLNQKKIANVYAVIIIVAYIAGFLTIQANTIATSLEMTVHFEPIISGVSLAILSGFIILKGVKGISEATGKLVPFMGIAYLILSFIILWDNLTLLPGIFISIIKEAFNLKSFGFGLLTTIMIGVERGIFATEAGLGSGAIAASASDSNNAIGQGMIQILGVYFTTFIICTSTALIILTTQYGQSMLTNINGIELTQYAFETHLGSIGSIVLSIIIMFFAFSTILTGYYYGETNIKFLNKNVTERHLLVLKIVTVLLLIWGSITKASLLWSIVDILAALMAIINMYAVLSLRKNVVKEWNNKHRMKNL